MDRVIYKRDLDENIRIYAGGQCHCIHPHTGKTCQEFACVNFHFDLLLSQTSL
uniref:SWIM-type domain-containing protein n=1 Tax=Heterorhabditis bacteriophora TaxID=37862 RepID=A0A1I7WEQ0_HETBA